MSFNQIRVYLKNIYGRDITQEELYAQINLGIEKIKSAVELVGTIKKIAVEVINGIVSSIKYGYYPHGITKEKLHITIDVLEKMEELSSEDENMKAAFRFLADITRKKIDDSNIRNW